MIREATISKDYLESGAMSSLIGLYGFVDEHIFLTKSGDLGVVLKVHGADGECLDHSARDQVARRFETALRTLDERFRIYQYLLKRDHAEIPRKHYDDPVVEEAISNRIAFLSSRNNGLYTIDIFFVLMYEGWQAAHSSGGRLRNLVSAPKDALRHLLPAEHAVTLFEDDLLRAIEVLSNAAATTSKQLEDAIGIEILSRADAFQFFRRLLNFSPKKLSNRIKYDIHLDHFACDSTLECHRDHLRLDNYYVEVLALKEPPSQTFANILQGLQDMQANFIIASEWKRETNLAARREIQSKRRHFHNSKTSLTNYVSDTPVDSTQMLVDDGAAALVTDLGGCLREIEVNGNYFGKFSLVIVLYDLDRVKLQRAAAECFKVFSSYDGALIDERYNLLNAFLSIIPGNRAFNLRRLWLLNTNYADLSFLFALHSGEPHNRHLDAEYLAVLETNSATPYFFNLHYQDVGHTLILGATGSGKSFLLNFLLTNLQKYQPLTYIFDLGGSYQSLTNLFGGAYKRMTVERQSFTINPFRLAYTPENLQFLFSFSKVLIESDGYVMSSGDHRDLYQQIENLYEIDPEQRRLFTLANILNRQLGQHLYKWIEGGQYGALFDNIDDNLTLATFQTFDFEGMGKYPQVLEPLLFYVLHRANASIYDPSLDTRFKVFVMDEAWRFLKNDTIRQYITEGVKTWRKRNAAMILATQSSDDLERSEMLSVIVESCATKMFLANPGMDRNAYRETFHLNETEAELIASLIPKQQLLIKRPDSSKVVNLKVDPAGYWLYTSNPYDIQRRREAFEKHGFTHGLELLARSSS